jgi:hypothetical protein
MILLEYDYPNRSCQIDTNDIRLIDFSNEVENGLNAIKICQKPTTPRLFWTWLWWAGNTDHSVSALPILNIL